MYLESHFAQICKRGASETTKVLSYELAASGMSFIAFCLGEEANPYFGHNFLFSKF